MDNWKQLVLGDEIRGNGRRKRIVSVFAVGKKRAFSRQWSCARVVSLPPGALPMPKRWYWVHDPDSRYGPLPKGV